MYNSIQNPPKPQRSQNWIVTLKALVLIAGCSIIVVAVIIVPLKHKKPSVSTRTVGGIDAVNAKSFLPLLNPYNLKVKPHPLKEHLIRSRLFDQFNGENIRNHLRILTKDVHVAGTKENLEVAKYIAQQYRSFGLEVKESDYQVLLGYPDYNKPNNIFVKTSSDSDWELVSDGLGKALGPPEALKQQTDPKARVWWNAYSANGTATGQIVYVNHGSLEDYKYLDKQNVSLAGKIALARYGGLWRGQKTFEAEKRGAIGVIVFSDPEDYGPPTDMPANFTFPNSVYLPPEGAQRGTMTLFDGDLLSPLYPAKSYVFRSTDEATLREQLTIPKVPVMPIGYGDAEKILRSFDGPLAPAHFQGGIRGLKYRLNSGKTQFKLVVNSRTNERSPIKNVCAYVRGMEEPDHLVILSNHFDAWTFGGFDPNSGTAATLEIGRVLMSVVNDTKWRPRRTIAICNWDAEEHGLIGSGEWLEEFYKLLSGRAVAVINVDTAASGNVSLSAAAVPLMYRALITAAKQVPNSNPSELSQGRKTMFDSWLHFYPDKNKEGQPAFDLPGAGSDHYLFLALGGVPVGSLGYKSCPPKGCANLYHSMYSVAWTAENLVDPQFKAHVGMSRLSLEYARLLADSLVIPFNVSDYSTMLAQSIDSLDAFLREHNLDKLLEDYTQAISNLRDAAGRFGAACGAFQEKVDGANSGDFEISLRQKDMINRRLVELERAFLNPRGLYRGRDNARHLVFASSAHNNYAGEVFSGIRDCIENFLHSGPNFEWLKQVREGISALQYSIESAILILDLDGF